MKSILLNPLIQALLLLCLMLQGAQAADNDRFLMSDRDGFVTSLPNVSDITVSQRLRELQQDLEVQIVLLKEDVKRKSFKTLDTLVTIVMPGGLIYAKLRHDSYKRSERRLLSASDRLDEITGELIAFETANGGLMLAVVD
jgi:hypothetical protein